MVTTPLANCALCGLPTAFPIAGLDDQRYCCPACREVARLLSEAPAPNANQPHTSNTTPIELTLGGLWCSSCAWLVQETLRRAPGVQEVTVSFLQRQARVTIDPSQTSGAHLVRRIRRLGYAAGMADAPRKDEEESLFTRLAFCGVFVLHDVIISSILYVRTWLQLNTPEDATLITFFQVMMLL